ncbi:hypothetical protein PICMEDRAFT_164660 [Pichia membranifaciens NRRL Y-2026]|uniref:Uncharacterized protein n=1 Tax=Pichia membranifaciens NRRL Y-2026 TaxID=763406 RepID=A0A1E3NHL4_9ASCO|nr:hypothetical protein PICMEDRAFT_164660 [Pichia membranifaciens NRRL Y-2026]ODQ45048.1 hypothetical protein PICMEDRAFT_164660 [Pichia membranifaciens NRRL Y-2026]
MVFKNIFQTDIDETENKNLSDEASAAKASGHTGEGPNAAYRSNSGFALDAGEKDGEGSDDADDGYGNEKERVHENSTSAERGYPNLKLKKESVYSELAETASHSTLLSGGSLTEEELKILIEEKRRKNLEASIRFRLKKKTRQTI